MIAFQYVVKRDDLLYENKENKTKWFKFSLSFKKSGTFDYVHEIQQFIM
jgi:hypothetical protein